MEGTAGHGPIPLIDDAADEHRHQRRSRTVKEGNDGQRHGGLEADRRAIVPDADEQRHGHQGGEEEQLDAVGRRAEAQLAHHHPQRDSDRADLIPPIERQARHANGLTDYCNTTGGEKRAKGEGRRAKEGRCCTALTYNVAWSRTFYLSLLPARNYRRGMVTRRRGDRGGLSPSPRPQLLRVRPALTRDAKLN